MATQIKTIIDKFLKTTKQQKKQKDNIDKILYKIFDTNTQKHIHSGAINKNKLVLYVDSSVVGYKARLLKNRILEDNKIKKHKINDIVIRVKNGTK